MKKVFLVLLSSLVLISFVGCSGEENSSEIEISTSSSEELEELSKTQVLYYTELLTGRYLTSEQYNGRGTNEFNSELEEIILDCNDTMKEMATSSTQSLPEESSQAQIIKLAKLVKDACQKILNENYNDMGDDAYDVGVQLRKVADNFADGELPPTMQMLLDQK